MQNEWKTGDSKMATLKDVAKRAGVSTATVSYVINNTGMISESTQERVLNAIRELNYRPNVLARNLRLQESKLIGLVMSNMDSDFYSSVASTMEEMLYQHGYSVLICNSNRDPEKERHYYNMLLSKMLSGVVIAPVVGRDSVIYQTKHQENLPVIVINRTYSEHNGTTVTIDNRGKAKDCVLHLANTHGYAEIAIIKNKEGIQNEDERFLGYREGLSQLGLQQEVYISSNYTDGVFGIVGEWIEQNRIPRSCFITETRLYIRLMAALRYYGIRCPEDIALIGFCDSNLGEFFLPPISAVRNPGELVAKVAVEELLKLLSGSPAQKKQILVDAEIHYRTSCGCHYFPENNTFWSEQEAYINT